MSLKKRPQTKLFIMLHFCFYLLPSTGEYSLLPANWHNQSRRPLCKVETKSGYSGDEQSIAGYTDVQSHFKKKHKNECPLQFTFIWTSPNTFYILVHSGLYR